MTETQATTVNSRWFRHSAAGVRPAEAALARAASGPLEVYVENVPDGAPADGVAQVSSGKMASARGGEGKEHVAYAFGAQFVEVRVHSRTGEIRAPRAVGAFAAGTVLNP
ncbi:MAG: molybdopterin cofactor-binding domain-containing protein, partial [Gemmatimonadales bacterium]